MSTADAIHVAWIANFGRSKRVLRDTGTGPARVGLTAKPALVGSFYRDQTGRFGYGYLFSEPWDSVFEPDHVASGIDLETFHSANLEGYFL